MPRRSNHDDFVQAPLNELRLPVPTPVRERPEHRIDPYQAAPGGVPTTDQKPKARRKKNDDIAAKESSEAADGLRYDLYLDRLIAMGGDKLAAIASIFNLSLQETQARFEELYAQIQHGKASSSIGELLDRNDLNKAAQVAILRRHAYSPNPAASLKALDMIGDLSGTNEEADSYDRYVRAIMQTG